MSEPITEDTQDQETTSWTIRKLADGKFVLSEGMEEYGYDSVDELLADLKADLGGEVEEAEPDTRKENVKKIMEESDEDY